MLYQSKPKVFLVSGCDGTVVDWRVPQSE